MKETFRFRGNPEALGDGNFLDFRNKEELLEMIGFCEPSFEATEPKQADEKQQLVRHSAENSCGHHLSWLPAVRSQEIPLAQEMR